MNNNDRFNKALDTDPLEAAALAIQFSGSCGSRRNAWNWAEDAVRAASSVGVVLNPGHASWPDLDAMERQLKAALDARLWGIAACPGPGRNGAPTEGGAGAMNDNDGFGCLLMGIAIMVILAYLVTAGAG